MNMQEYAKRKGIAIKDVKKKFAFKLYSSIVQKTPVDTGRARGNWQISVGSPNSEILDRTNTQGSPDLEEANKLETIKGDETIYIQNNLPYIVALENGHSKQAPLGMVDLTVYRASEDFKNALQESE